MTQELMKIEQELKEILEEGNRRVLEYQKEIDIAKENEEEANENVISARRGNDAKAYSKALEDKRMAESIAKFYNGKIEELRNKPYVTGCVEPNFNGLKKGMKVNYTEEEKDGKIRAINIVEI